MDREDTKFKISKKIRIATFIVLILCAILASIAWALFAGVMMTGNNLRFGQIDVCIGYYDSSGEQKTFADDQAMINGNEKDGKPVDADAMIKGHHNEDGERVPWKVSRTFFVKNCIDDVDGACYYRIFITPAPNRPNADPPYYDILGDYLEVNIWEVIGWDDPIKKTGPQYNREKPIIKALANDLNKDWYENRDTEEGTSTDTNENSDSDKNMGWNFLQKQASEGALDPGKSKDFYMEMTYSDVFLTQFIGTMTNEFDISYEFDISVEAVQAKHNGKNDENNPDVKIIEFND